MELRLSAEIKDRFQLPELLLLEEGNFPHLETSLWHTMH